MPAKLQPYPKYKNSGVDWIKSTPFDWTHDKIVSLFNFPNDKVGDVDFEPLSVTYGGVKKQVDDAAKTDNGTNRRLLKKDDIAFNGRSDRQGACGVSEYEGSISVVYHVLRKKSPNVDVRYYHHLFRNTLFSQEFYRLGRGIHDDMWTTRTLEMKRIQVPVPPLKTQKRIADFLDKKTRVIDELVAKKENLIELLREKRAAIITQAVTKGLDPKAKMKPSGIEWLGEIPEKWKVMPFKYGVNFQEGPGIMAADFRESGIPLLRIGNINTPFVLLEGCNYLSKEKVFSTWRHFLLDEGDLLISASATTGIVSEVDSCSKNTIAYTGIIRLTVNTKVALKNFVKYFVISKTYITQIDVLKSGSGLQHYGPSHLKRVFGIFPPLEYQKDIIIFLDFKIKEVDKVILLITQQIAQLKEYRSSLIYSAVVGKIKV